MTENIINELAKVNKCLLNDSIFKKNNGRLLTFEEQVAIVLKHLRLLSYGFGFEHSFFFKAEEIINQWFVCLRSIDSPLLNIGEENIISALKDEAGILAPEEIAQLQNPTFNFIDLFAGIGGFHQAMHAAGGNCVFACEWDKHARHTYEANYAELSPYLFERGEDGDYLFFKEDINNVLPEQIPQFDICCAGFPCQAFSIAGLRRGFEDTRGTLFFNVANIIRYKVNHGQAPKVILLENVKGLKSHDKGNTLKTILATLDELGYDYNYDVLNAKYFGVPQNRERLFIVAWDRRQVPYGEYRFPYGIDADGETIFDKKEVAKLAVRTHINDIFEPHDTLDPSFTISDRMWVGHQERKRRNKENGKGFGYSLFSPDATYSSTISARYWKDGSEILIDQTEFNLNPRKLTPVEAGRLQGYNIEGNGWENRDTSSTVHEQIPFNIVVSKKEAYHQFGNSVAVPVIKRLANEIVKQLVK